LAEQALPPGPARDLVDRFRALRHQRPRSIRTIAGRAGLSPSYVSEVLNGVKAPRPAAAARIAVALGADEHTVLEVRRLSEALDELRRFQRRAEPAGTSGIVRTAPSSVEVQRQPMQARPERYAVACSDGSRRCVVAVAGSLYRTRGADVWVNSENTDMVMARPTEFAVSAIVRYWGARRDDAGRIVDDVIADELAEQVGRRAPVAPGTVVVTGSGALAESHGVRRVIHVAAVSGEPAAGFRQVYNVAACVTNVLAAADRLAREDPAIRAVLFPLLGVGTGGGDVRRTVVAMVDTAVRFLREHPSTPLAEVQLLGFNALEWDALTAVLASDERLVRSA
jgi:transcriptional regulator with XRE-family HTH domain/O-acetyl-ADP-ribose deacetylase (regulator of RNase III)